MSLTDCADAGPMAGGLPNPLPPVLNPIAAVAALRPMRGVLCVRDYWHLQDHRRRCEEIGTGIQPLLAALIRARMEDARITLDEDIDPDVATGDSHVCYSVDRGAPQTRRLYHWGYPGEGLPALAVASLSGATLIGMTIGQQSPLLRMDGSVGHVQLLDVRAARDGLRR